MSKNDGKYGVGNTSQIINSLGDGITLGREGIKAGADGSQLILDAMKGNVSKDNLKDYGVNASVTVSINKSSFTSTTNSTTSVAGKINVGGEMMLISDGDVRLVNQQVTVGKDLTVEANNFEVLAGVNTHDSNSSSKSGGVSGGFDFVNWSPTAGANISKGSSNSNGTFYDNSTINVGGGFNLTTKGDAIFKGANVIADEFDFKIGGNMTIESLQDKYTSSSKNTGANLNLSVNDTIGDTASSLTGGINHSTSKENSNWVNNQTSLVSTNGGKITVGETLTNKGGIIGSLNADEKLSISAKEVIVEHIKDNSEGSTIGIGLSGIGKDTKVPQTSLQYGSHDKEQDTNSTFVNVVVTENGQEINIADKGANTDLSQAQVITRDETFDMIDTNLHTDLGNQQVRDQIVKDLVTIGKLPGKIVEAREETKNQLLSNDPQKIQQALQELAKKEGIEGDIRLVVISGEVLSGIRDEKNAHVDIVDDYTGSNQILYGTDSSGNKIYGEDISRSIEGNYISIVGNTFYVVDNSGNKHNYEATSDKVFGTPEAAQKYALDIYNIVSTDSSDPTNPSLGKEVSFVIYEVNSYNKKNQPQKIYDFTDGLIQDEYSAQPLKSYVHVPDLGNDPDGNLNIVIKQVGHTHGKKNPTKESEVFSSLSQNSIILNGRETFFTYNSGDILFSKSMNIPLSVGTSGKGNNLLNVAGPTGWIYYPDTSKVKYLGTINNYTIKNTLNYKPNFKIEADPQNPGMNKIIFKK